MKYFLALGALMSALFFGTETVSATNCALSERMAYKTAQSPAVYYITEGCTKHLMNQDQFFSYFDSWNDVKVTSVGTLQKIKDETGALSMGPKYYPRTGSIVKSADKPDIYYVVWFTKVKIASEEIFQAMGLKWEWVETVSDVTLDKLITSPESITTTDQVFDEGIYLFRYSDTPDKLHLLLPNFKTGQPLRHYLKNESLIDYIGYRRDRIPTLSPIYQFEMGAPIDNLEEFFTGYLGDAFGGVLGDFSNLGIEENFNNVLPIDDTSNTQDIHEENNLEDPWTNWNWDDSFVSDTEEETSPSENNIVYRVVDEDVDHIRGNIDAPITIIEYVDLECPFCKQYQETLKQVLERYPQEVRVVLRHFPLEMLHTQAKAEALAAECAGEQGKFWPFVDLVFQKTNSNDTLDFSKMGSYINYVGLDFRAFNSCYEKGLYNEKIEQDIADAWSAGAYGAPFSLIIAPRTNSVLPIHGAVTFEELQLEIEKLR